VAWTEVPGTGTLFTYAVVHQALLPALVDVVPYVVAIVEIDGTGGTRLTSNLVDAPLDSLRAGLAVEVTWEDMSPSLALPRFRLRSER
jgi:hypothetical protein